jgi:uncharacterized membrane protein YdbT with pleckstrin-like domain
MAVGAEQVFRPVGRAFFVYYVALAVCFLGPPINPAVGVPVWVGLLLGLVVLAAVFYMRAQEYRLTSRGLEKVSRLGGQRQEIPWERLGEVEVRRGFTQTLLRVGNLLIKDAFGGPDMFWFGLADPKAVKDLIDGRRP